MLPMPANCAVSLTFANRGENEHGMQIIGGPASQLVTKPMLEAAKLQWENGNDANGMASPGEALLIDLSEKVAGKACLQGVGGQEGAAVLVLRRFVQHLMGDQAVDEVEHELELQLQQGKIDTMALMRGKVKNKNARHNNCMADFEQEPDQANGRGTVCNLIHYPRIQTLANLAAVWMQQDNPLICEQNRYYDVSKCGIGWHGDAEREIVLGARFGKATKNMPMMFQAFYDHSPVGPKVSINLQRGDVYIMTSKAVGTDWKSSSIVTWRHAAGNPVTCSYVKEKPRKNESSLKSAIAKMKKPEKKPAKSDAKAIVAAHLEDGPIGQEMVEAEDAVEAVLDVENGA